MSASIYLTVLQRYLFFLCEQHSNTKCKVTCVKTADLKELISTCLWSDTMSKKYSPPSPQLVFKKFSFQSLKCWVMNCTNKDVETLYLANLSRCSKWRDDVTAFAPHKCKGITKTEQSFYMLFCDCVKQSS